jgi:DNA-directed RNA polymerase III subunit RPC6
MGGEENMVLSQIQAAGNEGDSINHVNHLYIFIYPAGIWTKHLKAKTELHQTIITRCLKSLESKQLIKAVKSVKVRFIYCAEADRFRATL